MLRYAHPYRRQPAGSEGHALVDWRNWTERTRLVALALVVALPVVAASAKATVIAYYAGPASTDSAAAPAGYEAEDHFPGAALYYAADQTTSPGIAAPGAGTTGTASLSDLPIPANADLTPDADGTVPPATPFSMARASILDRARALTCLATAIYYEAASESDEGQRAVAQVILNRVRHPAFPSTVCGVIYQGSERGSGCQFSYACDGSLARVAAASGMARATRIASAALAGYVFAPVGLATHYHTYAVTPAWNRSLVMTDAIGAHFFHRWRGYWGTPAAFNQAYRGGEPAPGPLARIALLPAVATPALPTLASTALPDPSIARTMASSIQPAFAGAGLARTDAVAADTLPGASPVLDRWKDSGKPLR
ncbi:cell wall hydrolase [uncultured Sphingomonas sp.]|uniref:cell wall hydrolase n=1 Tax=uncultured Sphingomonas sp. TaxID=158754 RepID=UPI0035CC15EC